MRILALFLLLSGCGTSMGFIRDSTTSQSFSYALDVKAVAMKRTVVASTDATTILCIIPTSGEPLYATAMDKLHKQAKLQPNEVLVNLREDKQILTYLILCKHKLTVSADVYQLSHAKPPPRPAAPQTRAAPSKECEKVYWDCMRGCESPECPARCKKKKLECDAGQEPPA